MSAIQSIQSGANSAAAAAVQRQAAPRPAPASAAQEAQESTAVTRAEAGRGDQQASRKLAVLQQSVGGQQAAPAAAKDTKGINLLA